MCRKRLKAAGELDRRYPKTVLPYAERAARLEAKYGREACWPWQSTNGNGYGKHREMYEAVVGPVPEGCDLDHLTCERTDCANPWHLDATPHRANLLRSDTIPSLNLAKTQCPNRHPYDALNTRHTSRGDRQCRACDRIRARARKKAQRTGVPYVDPFSEPKKRSA
jgi:hypothetical protein